MKVYAVLLIAALCATAIWAQEPEQKPAQSRRDRLVAKAKELQAKLTQALEAAKTKGEGVAKEVSKALKAKKEQAVAHLQKLQTELQAKLKDVQEKSGPIVQMIKKRAVERTMARIEKAIKQLQALEDKISKAH